MRMEARAYESIRERRKKSKSKPEPEKEGWEETITVEHQEGEIKIVVDEEENMPALLSEEEFGEIETEHGEDLPVLTREVEGAVQGKETLDVEVNVEEEEDELGEAEEIELGWEEAMEGDLDMAGGAFGELCVRVAEVVLEEWVDDADLLTGWELPGMGNPDNGSSPFQGRHCCQENIGFIRTFLQVGHVDRGLNCPP